MKTRLLVLSSSTGSGHDMRAKAFAQWVALLLPASHEVRVEQIIENSSLLGRFGVWLYNSIQKRCPWLHNVYFFVVEGFIAIHAGRVSFGGKYYRQLLEDYRPDVIFSVHDSTNRGYFEDARALLGPSVRCVTYCGEYSGGYGYSHHWVNPTADAFIARTHTAAQFAIQLGMPSERISVFHKFLPPDAFNPLMDEQEKSALKAELGLHPEKLTLFLATGGYGANHHLAFLKALTPLRNKLQVIVICGRNEDVRARLDHWKLSQPELGLHIEGFCTRMGQYLQISDAIITRGGANTTTEAIHYNCPILYNALGGLMPQEHCTVRYLVQREAATIIRRPSSLRSIVADWIDQPQRLPEIRRRMHRLIHDEEHPAMLLREVLNLPETPSVPLHTSFRA